MSLSNIFGPNNYRLTINTSEEGINLNGTKIKSQEEDNDYTYVLPERPTVEGQPQVMVSTLTGDTVDTTWVSAGGGVIPIPDPLVIDELQSQNIINDVNIQTDTLNSNTITNTGLITSNIIINNDYIQSPQLATSGLFLKSLTTYNPEKSCSFIFNSDGGNNITYVLPSSSLPEGEERVMTATRTGNLTGMNWVNPITTPLPSPKSFMWERTDSVTITNVQFEYAGSSGLLMDLLPDTNYKIWWNAKIGSNGPAPRNFNVFLNLQESTTIYSLDTLNTTRLNSDTERIPVPFLSVFRTNASIISRRIFITLVCPDQDCDVNESVLLIEPLLNLTIL